MNKLAMTISGAALSLALLLVDAVSVSVAFIWCALIICCFYFFLRLFSSKAPNLGFHNSQPA